MNNLVKLAIVVVVGTILYSVFGAETAQEAAEVYSNAVETRLDVLKNL